MGWCEVLVNIFFGYGVVILYGFGEDCYLVCCDGIVVLQLLEGVEWNLGQVIWLVVGIVVQLDIYIILLCCLIWLIQDDVMLQCLFVIIDVSEIVNVLVGDVVIMVIVVLVMDLVECFEWIVVYFNGLYVCFVMCWVEMVCGFVVCVQV